MIDVVVRLPEERWTVLFHLAVSCYHRDVILDELWELGASEEFLRQAEDLMDCGSLDYGMAYTNERMRTTVLVVSLASCAAEFQNTLSHEIFHMVDQYSAAEGITDWETRAYLMGDVSRAVFPYVREFLCGHCRTSFAR